MQNKSKTIDKAVKRRPEVVSCYWPEADCAYPWWIIFAPGYTYDNDGQHSYNGTVTDLVQYIRGARLCNCRECCNYRRGKNNR